MKKQTRRDIKKIKPEQVLLTFLKETKDGKYAPIETSSAPYIRLKERTDFVDIEENNYYYSIR